MSKIQLNLRDLFTSGTLGPVHVGMTIPELIEVVGDPVTTHNFDADEHYRIRILFYDGYEFEFHAFYDESGEYKLAGMQNDSINYQGAIKGAFNEKKVKLNTWFFRNEMTFEEVKTELDKENMTFVVAKKHEVLFITFPNQSDIFFEKREEENKWICRGWSLNPKF